MTQPGLGQVAKSAPGFSDPYLDRIKALELKVAQITTAQSGNAMTIDGPPGGVIKGGGSLTIIDADGNVVGKIGNFSNGIGVAFWRPDGTLAFDVFGGFVGIFDRAGNYVITDDTTSGQGIARPYVPFGAFADNSLPTQQTNLTTYQTVQTLIGYKQHPKVTAQILCRAEGGTTGQARLVDQDGTQVGATITIPDGDFSYHTIAPATLAGVHLAPISLNLQIRTTSGSGMVGARGVSAWSVESSAT